MDTTRHARRSRLRDARAQAWWWTPTVVVIAAALAGALSAVLTGEPIGVTLSLLAVVIVAATTAERARLEFRRGWRQGYEDAVRAMLEYSTGKTPEIEARAVLHGDPTPEPWDVHVPPLRSRSVS